MPTILIVDDEADIREMISGKLAGEGYDILQAENGIEGYKVARQNKPDLIILDLMMPDRNGISVCKDLRANSKTKRIPIIMLTARSEMDSKLEGLEVGADDYITKPFSLKELSLRVKGVLRRVSTVDTGAEVELGPFYLDKNHLRVSVANEDVDLTSTEFKLLLALIEVPGTPKERGELLQEVWGYSNLSQTRTLDTHIKRLRSKLGKYGACIETVRSVGYVFNVSAELNPE